MIIPNLGEDPLMPMSHDPHPILNPTNETNKHRKERKRERKKEGKKEREGEKENIPRVCRHLTANRLRGKSDFRPICSLRVLSASPRFLC